MSKKLETLTEHNDLITAHYDMSAPEQDIFSLVLSQMKKEDPPNKLYRVSIKEIEELVKKQIDYMKVKRAAKKLLSRVCTIIRDNGNPLYVSMISDAEHIQGEGCIEIGISPKLRPYLVDLKTNFTKYQLRIFGALRSKYSKRIYKMLSQFKTTGIMRISVEELKKRLKLLDPKTKKEMFAQNWTGFVDKVLEMAKKEINEFSDLRCTYEARKTGHKFTQLEFRIARVPLENLKAKYGEDPVTVKLYERLLKQFKLSEWQVSDIIIHVPEQEIRKTLYEIELQIVNHQLQSIGGYTAKTFDSKYQLGFFDKGEDNKDLRALSKEAKPPKCSNSLEKSTGEIVSVGDVIKKVNAVA